MNPTDQPDTRAMIQAAFGENTTDILMSATSMRYLSDHIEELIASRVEAEREAIAKLCDEFGDDYMQQARGGDQSGASDHKACAATEIAAAIRARAAKETTE
jgi:hypothetical protein